MTIEAMLDRLEAAFREGSVAVWCGAGASVPSGLPQAGELVARILARTSLSGPERERVTELVPETLPLERLMEVVLEAMDVPARRGFLELFRVGEPCSYHHFLACLAARGMLKAIGTTNFDPHLETALTDHGADHVIWHRPSTFDTIGWGDGKTHLVKLHGSVEDPEQLGVTVERLAAPGAAPLVKLPVQRLFADGDHGMVLTLGYSYSDRFDISPTLEEVVARGDAKEVVELYYEGREEFEIDSPGDEPEGHPLHAHPRWTRVRGDSEEVVRRLAHSLGLGELPEVERCGAWEEQLDHFFDGLDRQNAGLLADQLAALCMTMISDHPSSIPYYQKVVEGLEEADDPRPRLVALQGLGTAYHESGETDKALAVLEEAEPLAREVEGGAFVDTVLGRLANLYNSLAGVCAQRCLSFAEAALDVVQRDPEVTKADGDALRMVPHLNAIATAWMKLGDFDAAQQAFGYALPIVEKSGDLYRRAEVYGNIASLALIVRDLDAALRFYDQACEHSTLAGQRERLGVHTMNRGIVHVKRGDLDRAQQDFATAREILEEALWDGHPVLEQLDEYDAKLRRAREAASSRRPDGDDASE